MAREPGKKPADAEIRALIDDCARAVRAKDVDAVMRHYAADVVAFDLAPPLQCTGADALRTSLTAWFSTFRGPVGYEIRVTRADVPPTLLRAPAKRQRCERRRSASPP